nr:DUF1295 domain-containing protein [Bradyrhizobium sp. URHD0069]
MIRFASRSAGRRAAQAFPKRSAGWGRVCDVGPWRWSRDPNYFFE